MIIVLDPGHGSPDVGAVGPTGLRECDVVLAVARLVHDHLADACHDVRMTRTEDVYSSLAARAEFANRRGAHLFVSIHCNAAQDPAAHGTETWCYPGSANGRRLAEAIQRQLVARLGRRDRGVKESASLAVLKRTTMPAALVEVAFISNDEEEALLRRDDIRSAAARAIADGILAYAGAPSRGE